MIKECLCSEPLSSQLSCPPIMDVALCDEQKIMSIIYTAAQSPIIQYSWGLIATGNQKQMQVCGNKIPLKYFSLEMKF